MKRTTLSSIAILLFASITKAQIPKGSIFIGGQISGFKDKSKSNFNSQEQNSFYISPAIGTAIKQNLIAGIDLTYGHSKYEYASNPVLTTNAYGGGFFLRRYVPIANRFYFFAQGRAGYFHSKGESFSGNINSTNESDDASLSLYPGVSFTLSRVLHIEAGFNNVVLLDYSHSSSRQTGFADQSSNSFNFSTSANGTNFTFALRFIIPKK